MTFRNPGKIKLEDFVDIPGTTKFFVGTLESKIILFDTRNPTISSIIPISSPKITKLAYIKSVDVLLAVSMNKKCFKIEKTPSGY